MNLFESDAPKPSHAKKRTLQMHFDGGSRGNPGPAGVGVTICELPNGKAVYELGAYLGHCTNNVAEYTALVRGLEAVMILKPDKLVIRADSELVVRQLNGVYKVKSPDLKPLYEKAMGMIRRIKDVDISHVYREHNSRADALANAAMDRMEKLEPLGPVKGE